MSRFVINDIELSIPPTDINVNKRALNKEIYSLRSPLPNQTKTGKADIEVTFTAVFTSIEDLNFKLRPLVAQLRLTPFMYVENEYLRSTIFPQEKDRNRSMALTLRSLILEATSSAPGTIFTHFDTLFFNYLPYTPDFKFRNHLIPPDGIIKPVSPGESEPWRRFYGGKLKETIPMDSYFDPGIVLAYNEYTFGLKDKTKVVAEEVLRQEKDLLELISQDQKRLVEMIEALARDADPRKRFTDIPQLIRLIELQRNNPDGIPDFQLNSLDQVPLLGQDNPLTKLLENVVKTYNGKSLNEVNGTLSLLGEDYSIPTEVQEISNLLQKREQVVKNLSSLSDEYIQIENVTVDDGTGLLYGLFRRERFLPLVANQGAVVTDIRVEFRNQIAVIPLAGHVYSTHQYMGGDPARIHIGMKVLNKSALEEINKVYETVESNARHARFFPQSTLAIKAVNNFLGLFGLNRFLTENFQISATSSEPGTYTGTMSLVEIGDVKEELRQEKIVTTDVARKKIIDKALRQFISVDRRDDVVTATGGTRWVIQNKFTTPFYGQIVTGLGAVSRPLDPNKTIQARVTGQLLSTLEKALEIANDNPVDAAFFESLVDINRSFAGDFTPPRSGILIDPSFYGQWRVLRVIQRNELAQIALRSLTDEDVPGASIIKAITGLATFDDSTDSSEYSSKIPIDAARRAFQPFESDFNRRQSLEQKSNLIRGLGYNVDNQHWKLLDPPAGTEVDDIQFGGADDSTPEANTAFSALSLNVGSKEVISPVEAIAKLLRPISDALIVWADMIIGTGLYKQMEEFKDLGDLGLKGGAATYRDFPNLDNLLTPEELVGVKLPSVMLDPDFYFFNYMTDKGLFRDFLPEQLHARQTEQAHQANADPTISTNFKSTYLQNYLSPRAFNEMLGNYQSVTGASDINLQSRDADGGSDQALSVLPNTDFTLKTFGEASSAIKTIIRPTNARKITNHGSLFAPTQAQKIREEVPSENNTLGFKWPVPRPSVIKRGYFKDLRSHPTDLNKKKPHEAVDLAQPLGTPVKAAADGFISFADFGGSSFNNAAKKRIDDGYGYFIRIRHADGYETLYAHLEPAYYSDSTAPHNKTTYFDTRADPSIQPQPNNVRMPVASSHKLLPVKSGDVIGYVGDTGSSTGPHLHFEIIRNGEKLDPEEIIDGTGRNYSFDPNDSLSKFDLSFQQLLHEVVNQQGMRVVRAYPTFKLYFIEPDQYEDPYSFDDFFSYNSVEEITLVQDRQMPADLLYVRLSNMSGILSNRKWGPHQALDPITGRTREGDIDVTMPNGKPLQEFNLDPKRNNTDQENPIASLLLKEGTHIELRLGYSNDPDQLEPKFVGKIVSVNLIDTDDLVEIVCQSFGAELVQDIKGVTDDTAEAERLGGGGIFTGQMDGTTAKLLTRMISEPEIAHFGRYNKVVAYNSPNRKLLTEKWLLNKEVNDDNIFVPKDFSLPTGTGEFDSKKVPVGERAFGDAEPFLEFTQGQFADKDQLFAFGDDDSKPPSYWLYRTTVWDVFKEMELRHPGWIAHPVYYAGNYGPRMTMFFGTPDMLYFARDQSPEEAATLSRLSDLVEQYSADLVETNLDLVNPYSDPDVAAVKELLGNVPGRTTTTETEEMKKGKKEWLRRLSEILATRIGSRGPQIRPFRKYHLLTSEHHIIKNDMSVTRQNVFNVATVQYQEVLTFSDTLGQFIYSTGDDSVSIKVDALLPDDEAQEVFVQYPSCQTKAQAQRYGLGTLFRSLRDIYQGSIVAIGNPFVAPYDICFINDKYSNIVGAVEVDRVVHSLTRDAGYIIDIKPGLICHVNEVDTMVSKDVLGIMAASIYNRMSNLFSLGAPSNIKLDQQTIDPALGGSVILNPSLEKWGEMELNEFANLRTVSYTNFAHPIVYSPVLYHGRPWLAGISADKIKSKAWYVKFGQWFNRGVDGLEKRMTDWHSIQNVERIVNDSVSGDPTIRERIQRYLAR